jgi:hypothetical protein
MRVLHLRLLNLFSSFTAGYSLSKNDVAADVSRRKLNKGE